MVDVSSILPTTLRLLAKILKFIPSKKDEYEVIKKYEEKILPSGSSSAVEELEEEKSEVTWGDVSFQGQSRVSYCLECLQKHSYKALGLAEEALSFSRPKGEITEPAREKIRKAIKELVTAEDDLGVESRDEEINNRLKNIGIMMRDIRKWAWSVNLPTTQKDIAYVEELVNRLRYLAEYVDATAELYYKKFPEEECPVCKIVDELEEFIKEKKKEKEAEKLVENANTE